MEVSDARAVHQHLDGCVEFAGRVIEVVTGKNIHDALRELVFAPLGLPRTFTRLPDAIVYRTTLGHSQQAGRPQVLRPFQTPSSGTASGGLPPITEPMRCARFHLSNGAGADVRCLRAAA